MFSFKLVTELNRSFLSYAEYIVFMQCTHHNVYVLSCHMHAYICVYAYAYVCIEITFLRLSECDSTVLPQEVLNLCESTTSENLEPHAACTVTATNGQCRSGVTLKFGPRSISIVGRGHVYVTACLVMHIWECKARIKVLKVKMSSKFQQRCGIQIAQPSQSCSIIFLCSLDKPTAIMGSSLINNCRRL